jgi:hypothetical protein
VWQIINGYIDTQIALEVNWKWKKCDYLDVDLTKKQVDCENLNF